ncbi:MAG: Rieske (2Fe-2S) protein [Polyangiaceae bacterium]
MSADEQETEDWTELGPLSDFAEGAVMLKKLAGRRVACVRLGDELHALEDGCPHQGYPLSRGTLNGAVLTCPWHNWKFDVRSGDCTFGGEPAHRFPSRVDDGVVSLNTHRDPQREAKKLEESLRAAALEADVSRIVRDGLRLAAIDRAPSRRRDERGNVPSAALSILANDAANREPWGFGHGLATLADLVSWADEGLLSAEEVLAVTGFVVTDPLRARTQRPPGEPGSEPMLDPHEAARRVPDHLEREERGQAEIAVRFVVRALGADAAFEALSRFATRHVYDYGHGAIFLVKAFELSRRFPRVAESVFAAAAVNLAWATAETALPAFAATRRALTSLEASPVVASSRELDSAEREALESEVLAGEREAVRAVLEALTRGVSARNLLTAIGHAAAVRLLRFDPAWAHRVDMDTGVLDVTHLVTFTEAALVLAAAHGDRDPQLAARLAVLTAGFVGKLRRADRKDADSDALETSGQPVAADALAAAVRAREVSRARGLGRAMPEPERSRAYAALAPLAALDLATRPIFISHAVKLTEALRRLDRDDPLRSPVYLEALAGYLATPWPETRLRRTARLARQFLNDGRPPDGFY